MNHVQGRHSHGGVLQAFALRDKLHNHALRIPGVLMAYEKPVVVGVGSMDVLKSRTNRSYYSRWGNNDLNLLNNREYRDEAQSRHWGIGGDGIDIRTSCFTESSRLSSCPNGMQVSVAPFLRRITLQLPILRPKIFMATRKPFTAFRYTGIKLVSMLAGLVHHNPFVLGILISIIRYYTSSREPQCMC